MKTAPYRLIRIQTRSWDFALRNVLGQFVIERLIRSLLECHCECVIEIDNLLPQHIQKYEELKRRFKLQTQHLHWSEVSVQKMPLWTFYGDCQYPMSFFSWFNKTHRLDRKPTQIFDKLSQLMAQYGDSSAENFERVVYEGVGYFEEGRDSMPSVWMCEQNFFEEMRIKTPGIIARNINKRFSFAMTRFFVKFKISPHALTVLTFLIGIGGGGSLISGDYLVRVFGALCLQLSSILDGCDGEVARLKNKRTTFGAWFDTIADDFVNNIFFLFLLIGYLQENPPAFVVKWGILTFFATLWVSFFLYHGMILTRNPQAGDFTLSWLRRQNHKSESESKIYGKLKLFFKRDFFIFLSMILIILDQRDVLLVLFLPVWVTSFLYGLSFINDIMRRAR